MNINPEIVPVIMGHEPVLANALGDTAKWCDLSDCAGVLITVSHYNGGDTDLVLDIHEGDAASGTTPVAKDVLVWAALDALTDPTMVRQSNAKGFTIDTGVNSGSQVVQFYVASAGRKRYVQLGSSGGNVAGIVSVTYQKSMARYQGNESY